MAEKRKPIPKKLRFEVFKRDSFTCQYCGRMAPDVILEVDHINPVVEGGENDILNLITSCKDCNRGKGKRKLSNKDELKKQQEQLKEINEKRKQLEMLVEWKEELSKFKDEQIDKCEELASKYNKVFTETGRQKISNWIDRYGFSEVYDSYALALNQYIKKGEDAEFFKAFNSIPAIINNRRSDKVDPMISKRHYIKGILKNRGMLWNQGKLYAILNKYCKTEEDFENIKSMACTCRNWSEFQEYVEEFYGGEE